MQEINKITEKLAGIIDIYAVPLNNIKKIENKVLTLFSTENVFHFNAALESISHNDSTEQTKAGKKHSHRNSFFIPGQSTEADRLLFKLSRYKVVIIIRDQDNTYNIIGDAQLGTQIEYEYNNSQNWNGTKGYQIEFKTDLLIPIKPINYPFTYI